MAAGVVKWGNFGKPVPYVGSHQNNSYHHSLSFKHKPFTDISKKQTKNKCYLKKVLHIGLVFRCFASHKVFCIHTECTLDTHPLFQKKRLCLRNGLTKTLIITCKT